MPLSTIFQLYLTLCTFSFEISESRLSATRCLLQDIASPHCGDKRMARRSTKRSLPNYFDMTSYHWNVRHIESNTGKSARQGNLRHPRGFPCLALFAGVGFYFSLLSAVFSFVFVYVLLADDHVLYFCILRGGYYVIIWLIVRICVFIKD